MKVLLLSPLPPPVGGISRWSVIIKNELEKNPDWNVSHIDISPKHNGNNSIFKRIVFGISGMFKIFREFSSEIKDSVDVVHMTSSGGLALARDLLISRSSYKKHIPFVYHLHYGRLEEIFRKKGLECKLIERVFKYCSRIISIDKTTFDTLSVNGYREKTIYCPNPISVNALKTQTVPFENREKKVVFLGHILKEKGIEELLEAWNKVSERFPETTLEIIGEPYDKNYICKLKYGDRVKFAGLKDHDTAMKMLAKAEAFVLPSYSEGFPNVVLESMALSVPIIATNVGAIPEMLSGNCGKVVPPKSADAIADAMIDILSDKSASHRMADNALYKVNNEYDVRKVIEQYCAIWEKSVKEV